MAMLRLVFLMLCFLALRTSNAQNPTWLQPETKNLGVKQNFSVGNVVATHKLHVLTTGADALKAVGTVAVGKTATLEVSDGLGTSAVKGAGGFLTTAAGTFNFFAGFDGSEDLVEMNFSDGASVENSVLVNSTNVAMQVTAAAGGISAIANDDAAIQVGMFITDPEGARFQGKTTTSANWVMRGYEGNATPFTGDMVFGVRNDGVVFCDEVVRIFSPSNFTTIIGQDAGNFTMTGIQNTGLGQSTFTELTTGTNNVAIANSALMNLTDGNDNIGIGVASLGSVVNGVGNIAIGSNSDNPSDLDYTIAIGTGVQAIASNQAVIGGTDAAFIDNIYFGEGVESSTPQTNLTIRTTAGIGTNTPGTSMTIASGGASGNASTQSDINFATPDATSSGTNPQTFTNKFIIKKSGDLQIPSKGINTTAGDAATINSPVGRFRKDTSGASFTLTNSMITANSIINLTPANAAIDASATGWTISAGSGSATITFNAAPTANFDMNFTVLN